LQRPSIGAPEADVQNSFSECTRADIDASLKLYAAVMWTPMLPKREEGSADSGVNRLFRTFGPMNAMDVLLGDYDIS
jgi:hypothetical protein